MRIIILLSLIFFANIAVAQKNTYADLLSYYKTDKGFNGVVLVAKNGKIESLESAGYSSRELGTMFDAKSKFKIASITKTFTAVIILQLLEENKLGLTNKIVKFLPEYKGEGKFKTSIENLLTYSSGIPNCESYVGDGIYQLPITMNDFIDKYCSGNLESEPGTKFSYNNGDYVILGKIIEKITGKSFHQNLKERILDTLGMLDTDLLFSKDIVRGLVPSYTFDDSLQLYSADKPYYIENYFSAGAMYSTAEDLLKFDQAIFSNKLLKKETVAKMIAPFPKLQNVGLGFWFSEKYGALNTRFVYRPGGIYGANANWIHVLDSDRTIIVLSNTNATNLFEMSQHLNAVATNQPLVIPKTKASTSN